MTISSQRSAIRKGVLGGIFSLLISTSGVGAVRAEAPPVPQAQPVVPPSPQLLSPPAAPSVMPPSAPSSAPSGLSAAWEQSFTAVSPDPRPPSIVRDTHYIVSNEDNHYVWRNNIENRGGVFIGVGTDQNYVMAGWARPELLVLMDFDQVVVDLHRVYRVLFLNSPTPQDFLDLWEERNVRRVEEMIDALQTDAATRAGMLRAYRTAHYSVPRRLRKIDAMYRPLGVRWFMNDLSQYRYLVELFRTGRVIVRDFEDSAHFRNALQIEADDLYITKAAWLSEILHRVLLRTVFHASLQPETQNGVAAFLGIKPTEVDLNLTGLLWLNLANPVLPRLSTCFAGAEKISELDFLAKTPAGRRLLQFFR
mgnify:CR=1 FL=1